MHHLLLTSFLFVNFCPNSQEFDSIDEEDHQDINLKHEEYLVLVLD